MAAALFSSSGGNCLVAAEIAELHFMEVRDALKEKTMTKCAFYVPLQAKPGKEKEVADFLRSAVPLVNAELGTISWFAIQEGPSSFAIFDTFADEVIDRPLNVRFGVKIDAPSISAECPLCPRQR